VPDESNDKPETPETSEAEALVPGASEPVDTMSPEAIARRVAALGEEDASERLAREEEQKLAARRAQAKGAKGKRGLEAAASKRLQNIGGKVPPKRVAQAADASVMFAGSGSVNRWLRDNQRLVAVTAVAALVVLAGGGSYVWWTQRNETAASSTITAAVEDEQGRIGDPAKEDDETAARDPRPVFKTEADRRDAALAKYREVEAKYRGTGAAYLARLEEGSLLLDQPPDLDGAIAAFTDASTSPLAAADAEVKGRALEGLGFAYEAKAAAAPGEKDKWLDQAATSFRALENTDVKGFKELGMYHQARVAEAKGEKDKAVQLLKSLHERVTQAGENHAFVYLEAVAEDRLRQLDPTALPPKPKGGQMAGPGGGQMSDEQIQQLIEQFKRQQQQKGGGAPAPAPGPPK